MKKIIKTLIAFSILIFSSCGDSKFFSTEKVNVNVDKSTGYKTIDNFLNLQMIPDLRSKTDVEYSLLDYHGYNLLYNENTSEKTFTNDEIYLYQGKIELLDNLFFMDDIYSNLNEEVGSSGFNKKILKPIFKVSSEQILNPIYLKSVLNENPKFKQDMSLLYFHTRDREKSVSHVFHLYFLNNYLVKMIISEI